MAHDHPLAVSTRIIDENDTKTRPNRIIHELNELTDGVALVEAFSHVIVVDTDDGVVLVDSSGPGGGSKVVSAFRGWTDRRVHSIVYTHGHVDHVGGSRAFAADAEDRGHPKPRVVGHVAVNKRLERYEFTNGYNVGINLRQFGGGARHTAGDRGRIRFVPEGTLRVDAEYDSIHTESIGGLTFEHHHAKGETDDHTWTWIPEHKMITAGDLFIWNFPNCGNPQKVQRYPLEWAKALREMAAKRPELYVPSHGLPIEGEDRIQRCLDTVAGVLERLVADVLDAMNAEATLDEIVSSVAVDPALLDLPFLRPFYDEPEFAVRAIWGLYGGWWDGHPARLKPASDETIAIEVAELAGGAGVLAERAAVLADAGEWRLATELIEFAVRADPGNDSIHRIRIDVYERRRGIETSLMAKGVYTSAAADSQIALGQDAKPHLIFDMFAD
ncbi:MAG: MBL fold metallo-hydrolase [Actinomycetia bacterium]|nr:MBL fold metallo-hydrolase [Actinomycetes bacterium]